jgi:hypothetical protein
MDVELGVGEPTVKDSEGVGIVELQKDAAFRWFHKDLLRSVKNDHPFYRILNLGSTSLGNSHVLKHKTPNRRHLH